MPRCQIVLAQTIFLPWNGLQATRTSCWITVTIVVTWALHESHSNGALAPIALVL
jgi:hypothetical protein